MRHATLVILTLGEQWASFLSPAAAPDPRTRPVGHDSTQMMEASGPPSVDPQGAENAWRGASVPEGEGDSSKWGGLGGPDDREQGDQAGGYQRRDDGDDDDRIGEGEYV